MNLNYLAFEERKVLWQMEYDKFIGRIHYVSTIPELISEFKSLLAPLNDSNIQLFYLSQKKFNSDRIIDLGIEDELFQPQVIKETYLRSDFSETDYHISGVIKDVAIGYVYLKSINNYVSELYNHFNELQNIKGLILDLRHNSGGDIDITRLNLQGFTDQKKICCTITSRIQGKLVSYDWKSFPEGNYFDKTIILLTDYYTRGDAEKMVMFLKCLPNVKHIGGPTNGSPSTQKSIDLGDDLLLTYSNQLVKTQDGICYDGIGLSPDIYIKNQLSEVINNKDKTLERAIKELN